MTREINMVYEDYLHLGQNFDPQKYVIATYYLEPEDPADFQRVAGGVAAESSVGTWTELKTQEKDTFEKLSGKVFFADKTSGIIKIAYPLEIFELGNLPQFLSSLGGNIFGLKDIKNLRWLDFEAPKEFLDSFVGPAFGLEGIRRYYNIKDRPLLGSIMKPKLGLSYKDHAKIAGELFEAGIDYIKDDENLTSTPFNPFYERVKEVLRFKKEVEEKTGQKKLYLFNITAPFFEMKKRAEFVKEQGGEAIMVDILTCGFSAIYDIRTLNLGLVIHGHRAGHAAFSRNSKHGITNLVLARLARLCGIDQFHSGTVVGKMEGGKDEVVKIYEFLREEWGNLKKVLPIASGGLYPGLIPELVEIFGLDEGITFGGGIHGHPQGSTAGAKAVCQATEAVISKKSLAEYAKTHPELEQALLEWR